MESGVITIVWLILNLLLSLFLCFCILQYISSKQIISLTIIDLIYRDAILYTYLLCLFCSFAIIHCLCTNNPSKTLNYTYSISYSLAILYFAGNVTISLAISGALRLVTLINVSSMSINWATPKSTPC